jgi:hypothetical protein
VLFSPDEPVFVMIQTDAKKKVLKSGIVLRRPFLSSTYASSRLACRALETPFLTAHLE